jgi:hypothetical protein
VTGSQDTSTAPPWSIGCHTDGSAGAVDGTIRWHHGHPEQVGRTCCSSEVHRVVHLQQEDSRLATRAEACAYDWYVADSKFLKDTARQ